MLPQRLSIPRTLHAPHHLDVEVASTVRSLAADPENSGRVPVFAPFSAARVRVLCRNWCRVHPGAAASTAGSVMSGSARGLVMSVNISSARLYDSRARPDTGSAAGASQLWLPALSQVM